MADDRSIDIDLNDLDLDGDDPFISNDMTEQQQQQQQQQQRAEEGAGAVSLEFQSFGSSGADGQHLGVGHADVDLESPRLDDDDRSSLLGRNSPTTSAAKDASVFSLAYYQPWFNVTTAVIRQRLVKAVVPSPSTFYEAEGTHNRPDLYGPFWTVITLIFLMAATANFADYRGTENKSEWKSDYEKVSVAASVFGGVFAVVPLVVWFSLRRLGAPRSLVEIISLYGYSYVVFLPACLLCVLQVWWWQWLIVFTAFALSSQFLARNLWTYFDLSGENRVFGYLILLGTVGVNFAMMLIMKVYFFVN